MNVMPRRSRLKLPPLNLGKETQGQRLARIRKQRGYTQVELADKIGLLQNLVSAYETDRLRLNADMIVRFATALEVSSDELLGLKTSQNEKNDKKPNLRILRGVHKIQRLPPPQQKTILKTIDTFLKAAEK